MIAARPTSSATRRLPLFRCIGPCLVWLSTLFIATSLFAQDAVVEEPNEKAAKYHEALVRRPSGDYLFERFSNAWLDTGTLAGLEAFLTRRAGADGAGTGETLLLAYYYSKHGDDKKAAEIFAKALAADPANAEAWFEKAKLGARLLDFDEALADLDKAAAASPKDEVAIEIGKLKGKLLTQAGRGEEAITAWKALMEQHADDEELKEDLIDLHLAEGLVDEAIALMESLVTGSKDAYQKVTRQLRLGDIYQRSGKREEAIALYGESLAAAGRDTWLEKEVLAQIDQVFRREDDLAGLSTHLETLAAADAGRIALMKRRALVLAELRQDDEAAAAFAGILKLTPGDRGNREDFIDLLGRLGKHPEAAEQMAALAALYPDDAELIAQLAVRHSAAGAKDAARNSVADYLAKSDASEYAHLRAARLLEQFKDDEAAAGYFAKLVAAFPDSISAREAQAEFLHRTGKKEEATALWKTIAATGTEQDALRSARALSGRGEREAAYGILVERAEAFADDFQYLGQLCGEAVALEKFEEALPWAEKRLALASSAGELGDAIRQVVSLLERLERLTTHSEALAAKTNRTLSETCLLAEIHEGEGRYPEAEAVLKPALEAGEILAITQQIRLFRAREEWTRASEIQQRLLSLPDGKTSANVQDLVLLLRRAQKSDEALKWVEEWKKLSPGATQPWIEHSSILLEKDDEAGAIALMRTAVQRFDDQPELRAQLAGLHLQKAEYAEAERLFWTLYEESEELAQKITWSARLAEVASQSGRTDRLIEQFEERRRGNRTSIAPLLALAEIRRQENDYEGRRAALLEATRLRPEDLALLKEIARIEEQEGDWESAIETLASAASLDPTTETKRRIALLKLRYGQEEEGMNQLLDLSGGDEMKIESVLEFADAMIAKGDFERAGTFLSAHRPRFPDDYRLAYLTGITLLETDRQNDARPLFLSLLGWENELPGTKTSTAAITRPVPPEYLEAQEALKRNLPPGTQELSAQLYRRSETLAYRQRLRQRNVSFRQYSGSAGGSSAIELPSSLANLKEKAKSHLIDLSQEDTREDRDALARALEERGVAFADIILRIPQRDEYSNGQVLYPAELLEEFPDRPELLALAFYTQQNLVRNTPGLVEIALLTRCFETFKTDYPELALSAAICAGATGEEEGVALLRRGLAEIPFPKDPTSLLRSAISTAAADQSLYGQNGETQLPEEFRGKFNELLRTWTKETIAKNREKRGNTIQSFTSYDSYSWLLRGQEDLTDFIDYLDSEIERFETARRENPGAMAPGTSGILRQYPWIVQNRALLSLPQFPPADLVDFPPNVLIHFARIPELSRSTHPFDEESLAKQIDRVQSPVLKLLVAHTAGDEARTGKEIAALLDAAPAPAIRPLPLLQLAATYHASAGADPAKAITLYEEIRVQPMSKEMRRTTDAAIVACAIAAIKDDQADPEKADDPVIVKSREAALRLRYGSTASNHRNELIEALTTLGLTTEAEKLREKATSTSNRRSSTFTRSTQSPPDLGDRIKKLINDKKEEEAKKLAIQSIRPALRQIASGMAGGSVDYELLQLLRDLRNQETLYVSLKKDLAPADPATAKGEQILEWAAFLELNGEIDAAAEQYRAGLGALEGRKRPGIEARMTALMCFSDPAKAAEHLATIQTGDLPIFLEAIENFDNIDNYFGRGGDAQFERTLNLGRACTTWLSSLDEAALFKLDLSSLDNRVRQHGVGGQYSGNDSVYLPALCYELNPHNTWRIDGATAAKVAEMDQKRREIFESLCRAMIRSPQTATLAFSQLAGIRMAENEAKAATDPDLEALALATLETLTKPYRGVSGHSSRYMHEFDTAAIAFWSPDAYLIWRALKNGEKNAEPVLEKVRATKRRDALLRAEQLHAVAFGPAGDFEKSLDACLRGARGEWAMFGQNDHYYSGETLSVPAFLVACWSARPELAGFDMGAYAAALAKQSPNADALISVLLIERTLREKGAAAARPLYDQLALAVLGGRETWTDFKREERRKVNLSGNSYRYEGGQFLKPNQVRFALLMGRLCKQPDTMLATAAYLREAGLDANGQVTNDTLVSRIATPRLANDLDLTLRLFSTAPFLESIERFATFPTERGSQMRDCLEEVKKNPATRAGLREAATKKDTIGGDLVAAYLGDQPRASIAEVLARRRSEIDAAITQNKAGDIAQFVSAIYTDGGVDFDHVSADARAVFERLGTERAKSVRESVAEFLALKTLSAIEVDSDSDLEKQYLTLLPALWKLKEWDLGRQVYWHGVDLAREHMRKGTWSDYSLSGWNLEGDVLYDTMNSAPGSDLLRIAMFEHIINSDAGGRIAITSGGMGFANDLRDAFNRAGGEANLDRALDTVATELHDLCGDDSNVRLAFYLMEMAFQFRPVVIPRVVTWADARSEGKPWSPLARELGQALRMCLQTSMLPEHRTLWPKVTNLETWQDHYLAILQDETRPLPWRLAVADEVCDANANIRPDTAMVCTGVLAAALAADAPVNTWHCQRIAMQFNKLGRSTEWDALAKQLHEGWMHKNRNNQKPDESGLAFRPGSECVLAMLETHLRRADADATRLFITEKNAFDRMKDNARTVLTLVLYGDFEWAGQIVRDGYEFQDITDDYVVAATYFQVKYSQQLHEQLPRFLETVEDPAMRYFAELLVLGAFDPAPDQKKPGDNYPVRGVRLTEAAKRFATIEFGTSSRDQLLRQRSIQQIAAMDPSAGILGAMWDKEYNPASLREFCELENYKKLEHASRPLAAHAALRLRQGDHSIVDEFIRAVKEVNNDSYYRREAIEHFSWRLIESLKHRAPVAKPEEWTGYAIALGNLLSEPDEDLIRHDNFTVLIAAHLIASAMADREQELVDWSKALNNSRAEKIGTQMRTQSGPFWSTFTQILKTKAPDVKIRPTAETRERIIRVVFAPTITEKAFGSHEILFRPLVDQAMLTVEELRGETGSRLAEPFPRGGWAHAEIARYHADAGDWESALAASAKSVTISDPKASAYRFVRVYQRHLDLLLEAKRPDEAAKALAEMRGRIEETAIPEELRPPLAVIEKQINAKP